MHQGGGFELFSDYECEIRYHLGKANVVADTLSRKERVKPRHVRAMTVIIHSGVKEMIVAAYIEAKEWNSGDDQLKLRWMIYLVVLADAAESVRDAIGFEYCFSSSDGVIGPELVLETADKVVLIKEKLKAARDHQKSYADKRRKPLEFEVGMCLANANLHVSLDEIKVDKTLRFVKEPVEIMD
ncbi:hypothetical protein Tco_0812611 [Tanacetum coccineum]